MSRRPRHTDEEIERAAQAAEEFDPAGARVRDASELRRVASAADAVRAAECELRDAVAVAYLLGGYSWNRIADALNVSRQGARQRFSEWIEIKRTDPEFQERIQHAATSGRATHERVKGSSG